MDDDHLKRIPVQLGCPQILQADRLSSDPTEINKILVAAGITNLRVLRVDDGTFPVSNVHAVVVTEPSGQPTVLVLAWCGDGAAEAALASALGIAVAERGTAAALSGE